MKASKIAVSDSASDLSTTCNKQDSHKLGSDLWTDGLICAYEFIPGRKTRYRVGAKFSGRNVPFEGKFDADVKLKSGGWDDGSINLLEDSELNLADQMFESAESKDKFIKADPPKMQRLRSNHWVPIGWARLGELVQLVQVDAEWLPSSADDMSSNEDDVLSVADVAAPYWVAPAGPTWWCHVAAAHPRVISWLTNAQWLHPAISAALRDESKLISDRMRYLYYEVPVRVAGGLLFELLGQSIGDARRDEDDVPIVLRSWQAQNFLVTSIHVKGNISTLNVLGVMEVQDLVGVSSAGAPRSAHELISLLANRLARWDDRLFRKNIFGAADEVELKFVNRRGSEDLALLSIILNQEIRRLSTQAIRVKWSLHAREEIIFELSQHLRGKYTQELLHSTRQSTRDMIVEQEAVRDRIFTVQDAIQNSLRACLQDKSVRITHNLAVFGGGGLILSIITGLFGINVDGIPGNQHTPYAFALFAGCLLFLGAVLIGVGMLYLGLRKPITDEQVAVRKVELQDLVKSFQHAVETHAKVRNGSSSSLRTNKNHGTDSDLDEYDYILIA